MHRRTFMIASSGLVAAGALGATPTVTPDKGDEMTSPAPRVFVLIEIHAAAGKEAQTRDTFVHTIQTSHKPGILSAQIFEMATESGTFFSLQEWESEEAFRKHMSDNGKGLEASRSMLAGTPKLTILKHLG